MTELTPEEICIAWGRDLPPSFIEAINKVQEALLSKLQKMKLEDLREPINDILPGLCAGQGNALYNIITTKILSLISSYLAVQMEAAESKGYENGYITGYNKAKQEGINELPSLIKDIRASERKAILSQGKEPEQLDVNSRRLLDNLKDREGEGL